MELLPDCSQLCGVGSHGPIRFERLSAIRDFPDPDLDDEQRKAALDSGLSAEEITLKDERYLPISEMDLRAVLRDVKAVIAELMASPDSFVVSGLSLSGNNSAHPLIKELFHEALGCDVKLISPVLMPRVSGFSPDVLVQAVCLIDWFRVVFFPMNSCFPANYMKLPQRRPCPFLLRRMLR